MTWVRYDDNVRNHEKVESLDDATYRLWREAIEFSAQTLTDGVILARQLPLTSTRASVARARKLVERGLWHAAGTECPSKKCPPSGRDGWVIHDYFDYQPTREKVRAEQAAKKARQERWLEKKLADANKDASQGTSRDAPKDASQDVSRDGAPAPPRPAPEGRGGLRPPQRQPAAEGDGAAAGREVQPVAALDERAIAARAAAEAEAQRRATEAHEATTQRGLAAARAALRRVPDPAA